MWEDRKKYINKNKLPVSIKSQFQKPPQNNSWSDHKDPKKIIKIIFDAFFFIFIVLKKFILKKTKKKVINIGCTIDNLFVSFTNYIKKKLKFILFVENKHKKLKKKI